MGGVFATHHPDYQAPAAVHWCVAKTPRTLLSIPLPAPSPAAALSGVGRAGGGGVRAPVTATNPDSHRKRPTLSPADSAQTCHHLVTCRLASESDTQAPLVFVMESGHSCSYSLGGLQEPANPNAGSLRQRRCIEKAPGRDGFGAHPGLGTLTNPATPTRVGSFTLRYDLAPRPDPALSALKKSGNQRPWVRPDQKARPGRTPGFVIQHRWRTGPCRPHRTSVVQSLLCGSTNPQHGSTSPQRQQGIPQLQPVDRSRQLRRSLAPRSGLVLESQPQRRHSYTPWSRTSAPWRWPAPQNLVQSL